MEAEARAVLERLFPDRPGDWYEPMAIGSTRESRDAGAALILAGVKTATSALPSEFADGRPPFPGALSVVLDGSGRPRGVVETLRKELRPFGSADEAFAAAYGEGDRTLAWFRREIGAHYRGLVEGAGGVFGDDTVLVFEWFRLLHRV